MSDSACQATADISTDYARRLCHTQRLMGAAGFILLACSWKLWTPQTVFPQIPCFGWAVGLPPVIDWLSLLIVVVSSAVLVWKPASSTVHTQKKTLLSTCAVYGLILGFVSLVCLDQQRAQVWCYQLLLFSGVLVSATRTAQAIPALRWIVVGLYFHSGLSKCDHSFIHTYGQQLIETVLQQGGMTLQFQSETVRNCLAAAVPIIELSIACGLVFRKSRRCSLIAATIMHTLLLISLGPTGLNHQPTVLVWNCYFLIQVWILFGQSRVVSDQEPTMLPIVTQPHDLKTLRGFICFVLVLAAVVIPFAEPWGYCDHWPGWAVYASRSPRVKLLIQQQGRERLSAHQQRFLDDGQITNGWCHMDLRRWTLADLGVPIYPQRRFQLAVMLDLALECDLDSELRIEQYGIADRWTGRRSQSLLQNRQQLAAACESFLLNTRARQRP